MRYVPYAVLGCLGVVVAVIALTAASLALGWFGTAAHVISPQNVTSQWQFAYDYDRSLTAIAGQVCVAKQAVASASTTDERTQRESQLLAITNNYLRVEAEYDARLANAFEAKLVRPSDVPAQAPTLAQATAETCP